MRRESTHFPTAMIASRVYLDVVGRQTKGIAPRRSEGFEIHAARVDGRVEIRNPQKTRLSEHRGPYLADIITHPHDTHWKLT